MFKVEWQYKGADSVHSQEFADKEMADTLTSELRNSTIVAWLCVITPAGETLWF